MRPQPNELSIGLPVVVALALSYVLLVVSGVAFVVVLGLIAVCIGAVVIQALVLRRGR